MKIMRFVAALGFCLSLFAPQAAFAQINKPACAGEPCQAAEVGPFLQFVSKKCGNVGDCELRDIEIVLANIGSWILGIIGSLVFAAYIYGGVRWMTSGGNPKGVEAGKDAIKKATTGLVIVFVAYAGITSLKNALGLQVPGASGGVTGPLVTCTASTIAQPCGTNKECVLQGGSPVCLTRCAAQNNQGYPRYACRDINSIPAQNRQYCVQNLCDGGDNVRCCDTDELIRNSGYQTGG